MKRSGFWKYLLFAVLLTPLLGRFFAAGTFNAFSILSLSMATALIYFISSSIAVFPAFFKSLSRSHRFLFLLCAVILVGVQVLQWPGFVSFDDIVLLPALAQSQASGWVSFSYSLLLQAMIDITGSCFHVSLLNLYIYLLIVGTVLSMTEWELSVLSTWLVVAIVVSAPAQVFVLFQNRDSTFSLLLVLLLLSLLQRKYRPSPFQLKIWHIALIGVVLGDLRQEGKIILVFLPFLLFLSESKPFSKLKKEFLFLAVAAGLYYTIPTLLLQTVSYSDKYKTTAFVNPLSYILKEKGVKSLTSEQFQKINSYFDVQTLVDHYSPYDIDPFHKGGLHENASHEDYLHFKEAVWKIFEDNPGLLLENRWNMFLRIFNLDKASFFYWDDLRSMAPTELQSKVGTFQYHKIDGPLTEAQLSHLQFLEWELHSLPDPFHIIFSTGLIPVLFLFLLLLTVRTKPLLALCAALILTRTLIVVTLAPAGYFKYIASTWLAGWLLALIYYNWRQTATR